MYVEQVSIVKVVAAFVAGVVVALGSALIYVRASDIAQPTPPVQAKSVAPRPVLEPLPDTVADPPSPPSSPSQSEDAPLPELPTRRPKVRYTTPIYRDIAVVEPHKPVLQLARNTPPVTQNVPAVPVPPPAPALDDQAPAALQPPQPAPEPEPEPPAVVPVAPARQAHVVTLDSGTSVAIRLAETLSTDHNYTGDTFRATLDSPIIRDGFIIADKGSKVLGRIVNAQRAGRLEGVSNLTLALTEINTTDGQRVHIASSTYDKKGPTSTGEDAAKIAGGAALGAIIGAVAGGGKGAAIGAGVGGAAGTGAVMVTRGKPAVFPVETRLTFQLAGPVTITEKLNY